MTRLALLALLAGASLTTVRAEDPPKSDPPVSPAPDVTVHAYSAGDAQATVVKVSASAITLKIPQQVQNGYTTKSIRVPSGSSRGHTSYRTVKQQVPKYKVVQKEESFTLSPLVKVTTASGKASDLAAVQAGMPVIAHLSRITEARPNEKAETHFEITRLKVPNSNFVPRPAPSAKTPKSKKN